MPLDGTNKVGIALKRYKYTQKLSFCIGFIVFIVFIIFIIHINLKRKRNRFIAIQKIHQPSFNNRF